MTAVDSVQLTGLKASSLAELEAGLRRVDGSSIYHHTHRFYRAHSFLGPADRSDFALWVGDNLKEAIVAERMGSLDPREFPTLLGLQKALLEAMDPLRDDADRWARRVLPGLEFHFCKSVSLVFPTRYQARNLEEFARALQHVDIACIHHHLVEAPRYADPHPDRRFNNDLSQWLDDSGFSEQAQAVADLDPYSRDLEALREKLLEVFHPNRLGASLRRAAQRLRREPQGQAAVHWVQRWREEE
jgi:hypothetical protein